VSGVSGREVRRMQDWEDIAREAERIKNKHGL
jgi:hypothetical protein